VICAWGDGSEGGCTGAAGAAAAAHTAVPSVILTPARARAWCSATVPTNKPAAVPTARPVPTERVPAPINAPEAAPATVAGKTYEPGRTGAGAAPTVAVGTTVAEYPTQPPLQ
jgi:hypothetical protein